MNQIRATAGVGGGIGRSSEIDCSKALDVFSPSELYWSSFLDFARKKNVTETKRLAISDILIVFARERTENQSALGNELEPAWSPL